MGNAHDPLTVYTQSSIVQSKAKRNDSNRFRTAKRRIAVATPRHEKPRDGIAVPHALRYIHPCLRATADFRECV